MTTATTHTADGHELRHGYNLADLERLARIAAHHARACGTPAADRYELAWSTIAEALYAADTRPDPDDLLRAARRAQTRHTQDELRHHGKQRVTFEPMPRHAMYWDDTARPTPGPERRVVEETALYQIWPHLSAAERAAVHALAVHGTQRAAAAALGISYPAYASRLSRARTAFYRLWHEGETPSRLWRNDHRDIRESAHTAAMRSLRGRGRSHHPTKSGRSAA